MVRESGVGNIVRWNHSAIKEIENPQDSPYLDYLLSPAKDLAGRIVLQSQGVLTDEDVASKSKELVGILTSDMFNALTHHKAAEAVAKYCKLVDQQLGQQRQVA